MSGGRRIRCQWLTAAWRQGETGTARLGLAISRKAAASAVQRNRIKRTIREAFRQQSLPPVDLVFTARPRADRASAEELRHDVAGIWQRLNDGVRKSTTA